MQTQASRQIKSSKEFRKQNGAHYTPKELADFVAAQILEVGIDQSLSEKIKILDPAVGDGELLCSLVGKLTKQGYKNVEINGFDTDADALSVARERIENDFSLQNTALSCDSFIDISLEHKSTGPEPVLFPLEKYDLVIANPPYVRTQVLGRVESQNLAQKFELRGRVDLYHVFLHGIASVIRPGGVAGIIVSNRFMTTKSGAEIRKVIEREFEILHIWDLGDTRLFEAAVLPAVLILRKKRDSKKPEVPQFTSIYSTKNSTTSSGISSENVITALEYEGIVSVVDDQNYLITKGCLVFDNSHDVWSITTSDSKKWLSKVQTNTSCSFGDVGKIRVGVKTCADKIFIRSDWSSDEISCGPELLRPLITHHIARRFRSKAVQKKILYPHEFKNGKRIVVNLEEYPLSAEYLEKHRTTLESRSYVLESGRKWFEIWVPQDPSLWQKPKVVFRDISEKPTFWLDEEGSIVNGDCYWLTNDFKSDDDFLWLCLAVGNSTFIETFYDHRFNNKLYSGRRRFMTQYVEQFPLPDIRSKTAKNLIKITKQLYWEIDSVKSKEIEKQINQLVWQSFGFTVKEIIW